MLTLTGVVVSTRQVYFFDAFVNLFAQFVHVFVGIEFLKYGELVAAVTRAHAARFRADFAQRVADKLQRSVALEVSVSVVYSLKRVDVEEKEVQVLAVRKFLDTLG